MFILKNPATISIGRALQNHVPFILIMSPRVCIANEYAQTRKSYPCAIQGTWPASEIVTTFRNGGRLVARISGRYAANPGAKCR